MAWFRLECKARHDTKLRRAGPDAAWLWTCLGMYAVEQETDGFIPADEVRFICSWGKADALVERLVSAGLLLPCDGGYRIPNFLKYNLSSADSAALREKRAAAGRLGALSRVRQVLSKCLPSAEHGASNASVSVSDPFSGGSVDQARDGSLASFVELTYRREYEAEIMEPARPAPRAAETVAQWAAKEHVERADLAARMKVLVQKRIALNLMPHRWDELRPESATSSDWDSPPLKGSRDYYSDEKGAGG